MKKRKPTDATLRNVRATARRFTAVDKDIDYLTDELRHLRETVKQLTRRVHDLEVLSDRPEDVVES